MNRMPNKYWVPDGRYVPAWQLSNEELDLAIAQAAWNWQTIGMDYDHERLMELTTEFQIRLSPENVVRFNK